MAAGLSVADLVEKRDVVERYQQALARTGAGAPAAAPAAPAFSTAAGRPAMPGFVPASSPPEDPVAAAARAAAVPVRPSNPRPAEAPEWTQHTKGFGLDMMRKMGYTGGGLGREATGRAAPVEAGPMRPRGAGPRLRRRRHAGEGADGGAGERVRGGDARRVPLFHGQRRHRQDYNYEGPDHAADDAASVDGQRQGVRDGFYRCGRCVM